jgi:hypothetical protein
VVEAGRLRELVDSHGRACTQVLFLSKAELGIVRLLLVRRSEYSPVGTFHCRRSRLLETGFFSQIRKLKIQRKKSKR